MASAEPERKPFMICGFFRLDVPREEEAEYIRKRGWSSFIGVHDFITRTETQAVLISLLLADVMILFIELFLDGAFPYCPNMKDIGYCEVLNTSDFCEEPIYEFGCVKSPTYVKNSKTVLYYMSIAILFIFNIESAVLLYALGVKGFIRNLGNIFDVVVITTSIVLEIWLHESDEENAGAVLIIARLWRFLRIGHGITYASKRRAGAKRVLEEMPEIDDEPPYWKDPCCGFFRLKHDEELLHELLIKIREEKGEIMHWLSHLLHRSPRFQSFLIGLLLLDVCALFGSVFLDTQFPLCTIVQSQGKCSLLNPENFTSDPLCFTPSYEVNCIKDQQAVKIAKNVLYYTSISILAIFELEIFARFIVFGPKEFMRSLGNIFDFTIITVSLVLEVVYHENDDSSAFGVLAIARIWRFIRISHGILYAGGGERKKQAERLLELGAEALIDGEKEVSNTTRINPATDL